MEEPPHAACPEHSAGQAAGRGGEGVALSLILALFLLLYVSSSFGLVSTNDGSHFATTRALAERGTLRIQEEVAFALTDTSSHDARRYSSKPPGTAILALPLYGLSKLFPNALRVPAHEEEEAWYMVLAAVARKHRIPLTTASIESLYVKTRPQQDATTLLAAFAGVLALWTTYRMSRRLGASAWASGATLLALGAGTLLWRYSTALFSHAIGAALLAVQLEWLLSRRACNTRKGAFGWGFLLSAAVGVEYQAALAVPPLLLGWLLEARAGLPAREAARRLLALAGGFAIPIAGLACYQAVCFGGPLNTSASATDHIEQFWYTRSIHTMFAGHFWTGAKTMLFLEHPRGLFHVSPIVFVAVAGWLCWPREQRRLLLAALGVVVLHCAVFFKVMAPEGGATADHRYLVRILPVLVLPLGLALDRWIDLSRGRRPLGAWALPIGTAVLLALLSLSILRSYEAVADFMKHAALLPGSTPITDQPLQALAGKIDAAFPSRNHGFLLGLAAVLFGSFSGVAAWLGRRRVCVESPPRSTTTVPRRE